MSEKPEIPEERLKQLQSRGQRCAGRIPAQIRPSELEAIATELLSARQRLADAECTIERLKQALRSAKPYVERVHKQLWRTEFTAGGPAALAVAEAAELVDAALAPPAEAQKCICIIGCSVNGECPIHGDKAMPISGYNGMNRSESEARNSNPCCPHCGSTCFSGHAHYDRTRIMYGAGESRPAEAREGEQK